MQLFREKSSEKSVHATMAKGIVGGLVNCFSKHFERMARGTIESMLASAKEKQQK